MPPLKAIFHDEDGTLTGKGANSFATYFYEHHNQPECEHLEDEFNGVTCDNSVQIRRVAFWDSGPGRIFEGMGFKLLRYDDDLMGAMDDESKKTYIDDTEKYGTIPWKAKHTPVNGWATPFVTGHKYKIHWG